MCEAETMTDIKYADLPFNASVPTEELHVIVRIPKRPLPPSLQDMDYMVANQCASCAAKAVAEAVYGAPVIYRIDDFNDGAWIPAPTKVTA